MTNPVDHVEQEGRWAFDEGVTEVFDDMLNRSIPQYEVMRTAVDDVASAFVQPGTHLVDLGCSRGEAMARMVDRHAGNRVQFVGVEVSEPMVEAARSRFSEHIGSGDVQILQMDLREEYPVVRASATLVVLALQFTPIEHRQRILRRAWEHTVPGGALVLVEKVLGADADLDELLVDLYYELKRRNGYSDESINRKRLALEGVLVPVTAKWNEELLRMAGFRSVDCFWRWMNFAAWVAVKE